MVDEVRNYCDIAMAISNIIKMEGIIMIVMLIRRTGRNVRRRGRGGGEGNTTKEKISKIRCSSSNRVNCDTEKGEKEYIQLKSMSVQNNISHFLGDF